MNSEIRNPKSEGSPKSEIRICWRELTVIRHSARNYRLRAFRISDFDFRISFGFRISDFGFHFSPFPP
jgi:hypothetical protein